MAGVMWFSLRQKIRQKTYGEVLQLKSLKCWRYVIFCCVMHRKVSRDKRGNCTSSKSVSPNGLYSRQHLTAIHPSKACIYHCAAKKNHLYKSLSLPLSHKNLSSLKQGGILPVAWDNTICFQTCSKNVNIWQNMRDTPELLSQRWSAVPLIMHYLIRLHSCSGANCNPAMPSSYNYTERCWIWTRSSFLALELFVHIFLSCKFTTLNSHLKASFYWLHPLFLITEAQKPPGWFKAALIHILILTMGYRVTCDTLTKNQRPALLWVQLSVF